MNKVSTKAEIRFNVDTADWLDAHTKARVRSSSFVTKDGDLIVTSQRLRTQEGNLSDALDKLEEIILEAAQVPKERELKTEPSIHAKDKWRDEKRRASEVKSRRSGRGNDD